MQFTKNLRKGKTQAKLMPAYLAVPSQSYVVYIGELQIFYA